MRDIPVGIFDMHAMAGLDGVEGFLSLSFFRTAPVTIDYSGGLLILEDEASLARRAANGTCVSVDVDYDECSTDLSMGLDLSSARSIKVEVDTGSDTLILDEGLAEDAASLMRFKLPGGHRTGASRQERVRARLSGPHLSVCLSRDG